MASVGMMESTWICLNLVLRDFEGFVTLQVDRFQETIALEMQRVALIMYMRRGVLPRAFRQVRLLAPIKADKA